MVQLELQPLQGFYHHCLLQLPTWTDTQSRLKHASRSDRVILRPGVTTTSTMIDCTLQCKVILCSIKSGDCVFLVLNGNLFLGHILFLQFQQQIRTLSLSLSVCHLFLDFWWRKLFYCNVLFFVVRKGINIRLL